MNPNVGTIDRVLRIVAGIALITLAATGIFTPWGWIGVIPLLTGIFKCCLVYTLLGINTCPIEKK